MKKQNKEIILYKLLEIIHANQDNDLIEATRDFIKSYYRGTERINKMMELDDILEEDKEW